MLRNKIEVKNLKVNNFRFIATLNLIFYFLILISTLSFAEQDYIYNSKNKRNPFIPLVDSGGKLINLEREETGSDSDLLVDGIIFDKQGVSYCIVNGAVVGLGDSVGDYRVLKILEDRVVFIKDGLLREVVINKREAE